MQDCPPAAFEAHTAARVRLYLSLPDKRLFKAVIDGRTVGWTWWDVPHTGEPVVMPTRTFPEGTRNVEVATDFFQRMAANAAPMPCYGAFLGSGRWARADRAASHSSGDPGGGPRVPTKGYRKGVGAVGDRQGG